MHNGVEYIVTLHRQMHSYLFIVYKLTTRLHSVSSAYPSSSTYVMTKASNVNVCDILGDFSHRILAFSIQELHSGCLHVKIWYRSQDKSQLWLAFNEETLTFALREVCNCEQACNCLSTYVSTYRALITESEDRTRKNKWSSAWTERKTSARDDVICEAKLVQIAPA